MRRHYPLLHPVEKPFITTYHICEVPLPYYNPLQDPHLKNYFRNQQVSSHLQEMGLLYSPRKDYPYAERRSKNYHKHLKLNACKVPPENQSEIWGEKGRMAQSQQEFAREKEGSRYFGAQKRGASQILRKTGSRWSQQLGEVIANRRPDTFGVRRRNFSPDVRSKSNILQRRNFSTRPQNIQNSEQAH